jgi:AAHS family 4-hydroxybenzoate transporter-like MFS transporter
MLSEDRPRVRPDSARLNLSRLADEGAWTRKSILLLGALAIIVDGFDNQILGVAIPAMAREWGVLPARFAIAVAVGMIGTMLGTFFGGLLGDRLGRKRALVGSMILFGVATGVTALMNDVVGAAVCRFLAGAGMGGAIPASSSLIAEYTPSRRRFFAVTTGITSIAVGAVAAGAVASSILPEFGWRVLYVIGAGLALLVALLLARAMPESYAYLVQRGIGGARLKRAVRVLGATGNSPAQFEIEQPPRDMSSIRDILGPRLRHDTLALWAAFLITLFAMYTIVNWLPSLLSSLGFSESVSSSSIALFNAVGMIATITVAAVVSRFGSKHVLLTIAAGAMVSALVLALMPANRANAGAMLAAIAALGAFLVTLQGCLYAVAAHIYPAAIRATGIGAALSVGRIGALMSSYGGARAIGGGNFVYFLLIAIASALAFVALWLIRDHIAPAARQAMLTGERR